MLNSGIINQDIGLGIRQEYIIFLRKTGEYFYLKNLSSITSTTATQQDQTVVSTRNNGKTIIKRPIRYQKLKQQQQRRDGKSNNLFHDFIDLFFQPLLHLLSSFHFSRMSSSSSSSSSKASSNVPSLSILEQTKDEFNLIASSFPSDKATSGTSERSVINQSSFSTSSHSSPKKKPLIEEVTFTGNSVSVGLSDLKKQKKIDTSSSSKVDSTPSKIDEYDYLLPYDALLTLAMFLKYSIFHLKYR
jgi:hypothetical protein